MTELIEETYEEPTDYVEDEALAQIVDQMWASYFAHTEFLVPAYEPHDIEGEILCASVTISGARPGIVTVSVERPLAAPLAGALLQEDGELTDEDVYDSLGEVSNIVGGNIKALVPDAGPLGLPVVSTAKPLHGASDRLAARLDANWQGQWLTFEVWLAAAAPSEEVRA
ncbi:chemotaxis protein CheX [Kineococcus sp. SYSU DK003]|uniref:chemotaxis protein CheX n=1 Tax=Kineococcus sp. SYSU DK003 TaxID=3383124 RepID=UPI003D7D413E